MVAVPGTRPVTTPLAELTDAMVVALLLHDPPAEASVRVIVDPTQTFAGPATGAAEPALHIRLITLLPASAMYIIPAASSETILGPCSLEAVAGPPSPV
jgi:hypothetical protein